MERGMLYQIHRYPADLIDVVHVAGGRRVVIRPVLPQDEALTGAFFRSLPAPARYDRFLTQMRELPPGLLRRFTQVDYADHLALVAEVFEGGREVVIGEARYVRSGEAAAEFAVSISAEWQGKGLASMMLGKLTCRAATAGITRMHGETLASNEKMLRLAGKAGFTARPSPDIRGLMLLEKVIEPPRPGRICSGMQERGTLAA
ncbi:MAG: GNAT family N-acetyltransferase [Hyphomicrobiaceae bacterium]|nr:MAG: GNAT family N-acetyltransferase [Hyphomicrobiaceae bacterium]